MHGFMNYCPDVSQAIPITAIRKHNVAALIWQAYNCMASNTIRLPQKSSVLEKWRVWQRQATIGHEETFAHILFVLPKRAPDEMPSLVVLWANSRHLA
jgi:hypothetical protein